MRNVLILVVAIGLMIAITVPNGFAQQFTGRQILDNIFNGISRNRRGDQGDNTQKRKNRVDRPAADSYEQTEHKLALLEAALRLQSQQKEPWESFAARVSDYAGDLSRERARAGIPVPEGTPISGLQHINQLTDLARARLSELEEIRSAANKLYATLSPDQKKIADARIVTIVAPPSELTGETSSGNGTDLSATAKARR